ncbi:MAG TPA: Rrf2 family transcriptional regulator [bacterium]|nr:MAG: HTH-type transcriptional regulator IscR [bacterium ADurb.Bin236]HOC93235.1 Rrf2 family transcriptional regulator [bacterium]HOY65206.1 Rrf2 family transcriptional regulator [bacterium]HPN94313.1 Rrf2 family transcriptional regulator [bacterium]
MSNMLKLSDAAAMGFHAMAIMGTNYKKGPVTTKEISEMLDVSEAHMSKVIQRLAKSGLVISTRGPKGGSELAKPPAKIRLIDVYEAVEGPFRISDCLLHKKTMKCKECAFQGLAHEVNKLAMDYLNQTTVDKVKIG